MHARKCGRQIAIETCDKWQARRNRQPRTQCPKIADGDEERGQRRDSSKSDAFRGFRNRLHDAFKTAYLMGGQGDEYRNRAQNIACGYECSTRQKAAWQVSARVFYFIS